MNLLAAKLYDPTTAVNKVTTAALAMTALDTTNLRLAITVPAHGIVRFRLSGTLHGATTMPQILLGVMNGAAILGRIAPMHGATNIAATSLVKVEAEFTATGLTPGAMNVDAAYGVETLVAATGLKYGGPNNTTANDAFGGFVFEAWDPQSQTANSTLAVDASGRVDVSKVAGTAQTARDLGLQLDAAVSTRATPTNITAGTITTATNLTNLPTIPANWLTAAGIAATALNGKGDWNVGKTGYSLTQTFPGNFSALAITVGGAVTAGTVSDKTGYTLTAGPLDAAGTRSAIGLASANLDTQLGTLLPTASYTAPDNASITAIKAKTDSLAFSIAGYVDAGVYKLNGVTVLGTGAAGDLWRG